MAINDSTPVNHRTFIYPGSFDPVTLGHMDLIIRASGMCERLIVAVGQNHEKKTMFTLDERLDMLRDVTRSLPDNNGAGPAAIEVTSFDGLLVECAKKLGAGVIIKGLRAVSDYEYEYQMASLNKYLANDLETVFIMTDIRYSHISSSAVRDIAFHGGRLDGLAPECIINKIKIKVNKK